MKKKRKKISRFRSENNRLRKILGGVYRVILVFQTLYLFGIQVFVCNIVLTKQTI